MPITLAIDHDKRRVTATVEGTHGAFDGIATLARIFAAGAVPYGKLIDLTFAKPENGAKAIRQLSGFVASAIRGKKPGPLAIVAKSELVREMAEMFDQQVRAERPFRIFEDIDSAAAWLDELAGETDTRLAG